MVVKHKNSIPFESESSYNGVQKKYLIGKNDGSNEIIMRYFVVEPQESTPYHSHLFPHLVHVERGKGVVVNYDGEKIPISPGALVYIDDCETHCFTNVSDSERLEFICIVPERGDK